MRKAIRNQLIELLGSIDEGIKSTRKLPPDNAHNVLVDCYDAVGALERALERELSPEGAARYAGSISGLRESLEAVNASLDTPAFDAAAVKSSRNGIKSLKGLLRKEPEVRPEWVFMPYNASMWDALESVWLAAKDTCDCYVVPIPYYERSPDGSMRESRYEGDRLPEYVPVTPYSEYDITLRRPDAIFIHNPYDGNNRVTSVHPDYYTDRLKQYTDMLVYIPYYVTFGGVPESFTQLPSYRNVDKVIVQAKKARDRYLKLWPQNKIVALGSPKFDKVISSNKNPPPMPEEWARIARGRKLIFYNTTLSALLQYDEKYIRKLRAVIEHFRDDERFVLLWRPHPLGKATVNSMRPQLLEAYQGIVKDFRESEAGIYDDSADLHRAMALSSAYFGDDGSSVAALYAASGKPVILQAIGFTRYFKEPELLLSGVTIGKDGGLWAGILGFNALFKADFETGRIEKIIKSEEDFVFWGLAPQMGLVESRLVCAPGAGKKIILIDTETCETVYRKPEPSKRNPSIIHPYSFVGIHRCGGALYLIPYLYQAIIRYDIASGEWEYLTDWLARMKKRLKTPPKLLFYKNAVTRESSLLLLLRESNTVMELDAKTGASRFFDIGGDGNRYIGIAFDGEAYWLIPGNKETGVVRWNYETGETVEYRDFPEGFTDGRFVDIVEYQGDFLLFPSNANMILRLNPQTGAMTEFDGLPVNRDGAEDFQYSFAERHGDWIYAFARFDRTLYRLNVETGEVQRQSFRLSPEQRDDLYAAPKSKLTLEKDDPPTWYLIPELSAQGSLCHFLGTPLDKEEPPDFGERDIFKTIAENLDGTAGEKIRDYLMKLF